MSRKDSSIRLSIKCAQKPYADSLSVALFQFVIDFFQIVLADEQLPG